MFVLHYRGLIRVGQSSRRKRLKDEVRHRRLEWQEKRWSVLFLVSNLVRYTRIQVTDQFRPSLCQARLRYISSDQGNQMADCNEEWKFRKPETGPTLHSLLHTG